MKKEQPDLLRYLAINADDEKWGLICTTVGYQVVRAGERYPVSQHPDTYNFKSQEGRVLNEYQLVYIIEGSGYFQSASCRRTKVSPGTMMLLFPGERHRYAPDPQRGWTEYWVGFRGSNMDQRLADGFFSEREPLHKIGVSETMINLYDKIIDFAEQEKAGYQPLISGIIVHMLGLVYYKQLNQAYANSAIVDKINQARTLMRNSVEHPLPIEAIAKELGLGYSWFRRVFKQYTGMSPSQYQMQLRLIRAKEMLGRDMMVSEVAYAIGFDSVSQFSSFFKNKEGITPTEFKERIK